MRSAEFCIKTIKRNKIKQHRKNKCTSLEWFWGLLWFMTLIFDLFI